ncbi:MAG: ACP phosphodiesterase [Thermomonas sp.]
MNYLAHAWLARQSDEAILGALLGDFVFGQAALRDWPAVVRREIVVHRHVDRFTDSHPDVVAARALFPDGLRRYAGIALDVHFDHLLARDWARRDGGSLDDFTARVYRVLREHRDALPSRLRAIAPKMERNDWLGSYRERASVDHAVRGIATRLSRHGERLVECLPLLRTHEAGIDAAFERFFPDLIAAVPRLRAQVAG